MKVCLGHPGLFKCQVLVIVAKALTLVHSVLWLEMLRWPCARLLCQPPDSQCLRVGQQMVPGTREPLKGPRLVVSSLTPSWLSLPPFPASQTLWF